MQRWMPPALTALLLACLLGGCATPLPPPRAIVYDTALDEWRIEYDEAATEPLETIEVLTLHECELVEGFFLPETVPWFGNRASLRPNGLDLRPRLPKTVEYDEVNGWHIQSGRVRLGIPRDEIRSAGGVHVQVLRTKVVQNRSDPNRSRYVIIWSHMVFTL